MTDIVFLHYCKISSLGARRHFYNMCSAIFAALTVVEDEFRFLFYGKLSGLVMNHI